jgi:hypothetical protein
MDETIAPSGFRTHNYSVSVIRTRRGPRAAFVIRFIVIKKHRFDLACQKGNVYNLMLPSEETSAVLRKVTLFAVRPVLKSGQVGCWGGGGDRSVCRCLFEHVWKTPARRMKWVGCVLSLIGEKCVQGLSYGRIMLKRVLNGM